MKQGKYHSSNECGARVATDLECGLVGKGIWVTFPFSGDPLLKYYCLDPLTILFSTSNNLNLAFT